MILHKFNADYTITNINVILSNLTQKLVTISNITEKHLNFLSYSISKDSVQVNI
jgi:hypothetical protein